MVINTSEEAIEVHHAKCVEQSWNDVLCSKMTDFVAKTDIIDVLPCLVLKQGVCKFLEGVNVDILWYTYVFY